MTLASLLCHFTFVSVSYKAELDPGRLEQSQVEYLIDEEAQLTLYGSILSASGNNTDHHVFRATWKPLLELQSGT